VHESAEEEIVHPRAKRRIANGAAAVDKRLKEEHEAKTEFTRHLTELRDAVLDHAGREETDELVKLGEELSDDELATMGRAAKLAEAIAPARPHAGAESQLTNPTANPFAAMLDRARDAIISKG
jgi:hypothetical protein